MALVLASRLHYSPDAVHQLASDMVEPLQLGGAGADAAVLMVEVLGDVDGGVGALVGAKEWREALRVAGGRGRPDLVDTVVLPAAAQVGGRGGVGRGELRGGGGVEGGGGGRGGGKEGGRGRPDLVDTVVLPAAAQMRGGARGVCVCVHGRVQGRGGVEQ